MGSRNFFAFLASSCLDPPRVVYGPDLLDRVRLQRTLLQQMTEGLEDFIRGGHTRSIGIGHLGS